MRFIIAMVCFIQKMDSPYQQLIHLLNQLLISTVDGEKEKASLVKMEYYCGATKLMCIA